jgi:hypothetical protein
MLCHQFLRFLQIFGKIFDVFLKINVMSVFCLNRVIRVKNASNLDVFYAEIKAILLTPDELVKKNIIKKIKSSSKIGLLLYFKKKLSEVNYRPMVDSSANLDPILRL